MFKKLGLASVLAILGPFGYSTAAGETTYTNDDAVQFVYHTQMPLGINMEIMSRNQIIKWERRPVLRVMSPKGDVTAIEDHLEAAADVISDHLDLTPRFRRNSSTPDIVFQAYHASETNPRAALQEILRLYFDPEISGSALEARLWEVDDFGSGCTTWFFDRMTDLRKIDPFVVVLVDLDIYSGQELRSCLYEELGHGMTFFQDIPQTIEYDGRILEFSTLFQVGEEKHDNFTPTDLRMIQLLALPEITNGMQSSEANAVIFDHVGI